MDAITIQILRNKIASLVDEMHYHFYRSGYSTIIRESRDFSCVILDRDGRLIVAPPMFFHAPVYRHLVGRILEVYGKRGRDPRRRRVRLQPSLRRRPAACLRHGVRRAGLRRRPDRRLLGLDRAQGRRRRHGAGLDLGQRDRDVSTKACCCRRSRSGKPASALPDIERIILTNSRQPELVRGDIHAQIAVTQMGAARVKELCGRFGAATVTDAFAAILKGAADELRGRDREAAGRHIIGRRLSRQRRHRGRQADQARRHDRDQGRPRAASIFPTAIRRPRGRSICGPRWSRPACSIR